MRLSDLTTAARLFADPARGAMLMYLLDGRARPAGELAKAARITPQTASSHLALLLDHQVLALETEGRHRYYRLARPEVAELMEQLSTTLPRRKPTLQPLPRQAHELAFARSCYNHLAGRLGTAVFAALLERGHIQHANARQCTLTPPGQRWFRQAFELAPDASLPSQGRCCLDWTEREHHLAGALGTALLQHFRQRDWVRQRAGSRAVLVTDMGAAALSRLLGLEIASLHPQRQRG